MKEREKEEDVCPLFRNVFCGLLRRLNRGEHVHIL
jgi:hypothetical protein